MTDECVYIEMWPHVIGDHDIVKHDITSLDDQMTTERWTIRATEWTRHEVQDIKRDHNRIEAQPHSTAGTCMAKTSQLLMHVDANSWYYTCVMHINDFASQFFYLD